MTEQPEPGIAAKYPSTCSRCGEPIVRGDRVVFHRGSYIHCACANGAADE